MEPSILFFFYRKLHLLFVRRVFSHASLEKRVAAQAFSI